MQVLKALIKVHGPVPVLGIHYLSSATAVERGTLTGPHWVLIQGELRIRGNTFDLSYVKAMPTMFALREDAVRAVMTQEQGYFPLLLLQSPATEILGENGAAYLLAHARFHYGKWHWTPTDEEKTALPELIAAYQDNLRPTEQIAATAKAFQDFSRAIGISAKQAAEAISATIIEAFKDKITKRNP